MPATVGVSVSTVELDKLLQQLGAKVTDLRPFFHAIDRDVSNLFVEQWETRGARFGTPWEALSPATVAVRIARRIASKRGRQKAAAAAGADTPLYDSGGLFASFTKPDGPGSVRQIGKLEYVRGSQYAPDGIPVASLMQEGFSSPFKPVMTRDGDVVFVRRKDGPKRVPPRPIVPTDMPLPVLNAWEGQLVAFIESGALD